MLDQAHHKLERVENRRLIDGDPEKLRYSAKALKSEEYLPYERFTEACVAEIVRRLRLTRLQTGQLFHVLRQTDKTGNGLRPQDVPKSADHFKRNMRQRTPLCPV